MGAALIYKKNGKIYKVGTGNQGGTAVNLFTAIPKTVHIVPGNEFRMYYAKSDKFDPYVKGIDGKICR